MALRDPLDQAVTHHAAKIVGHAGARVLAERVLRSATPLIAEPEGRDPATVGDGWLDEIGELRTVDPSPSRR